MNYYGTDQAPNWHFCTVTTPAQVFSRTNGSQTTPITGTVYSVSSNPYQNMLDGYYTNGTHMIVLTSGNIVPNSGNIGFNTSVKTMAESHWIGAQDDAAPIITPIASTVFQPAIDNCKTLVIFPRQGSWVELNSFCNYATVVNNHGSVIFGAKDVNACNIVIQSENGANSTITVGNNVTSMSVLAHKWSCDCSGTCSTNILVNISLCLVNFTAIGNTSLQYDGAIHDNVASPGATPMRQHSSVWSVLFWVIIACIIIFVIVFACHCCLKCCSSSAQQKAATKTAKPKDNKPDGKYNAVPSEGSSV